MEEKIEHLKFIINRYDAYIESVQSKSNLYLVLNTFLLGGCVTALGLIKPNHLDIFLFIGLGLILLSGVTVFFITLTILNPHLLKNKNSKSIIFFVDVANTPLKEYKTKIEKFKIESFIDDLADQIHCIAIGLKSKYNRLTVVGWILSFQFILSIAWLVWFIIKNNIYGSI